MHIIDCKGLKCPTPLINTKKYFDSIEEGKAKIIVDNEVAKNNIVKFTESNGFTYEVTESKDLFEIVIEKDNCNCAPIELAEDLSIVITSDKLGDGDDTLGETLMKSYLFALSESDNIPKTLIFMNGGVKLTIEESSCLESITRLSERGVEILSCGACLDFFEVKDKLAVGEISNMYTIVEKMNKSKNTIKL
ncbi:sulfurtransferase-like selenium metabolism protein YedF [Clostridium sp.]|uniref:sulfurtransferase-like selenium metabolism protein YedF n=1 Tax=Clostridium sp. TaxID=1506 RepID=UPI003464123F